jgi:hypothetical protein
VKNQDCGEERRELKEVARGGIGYLLCGRDSPDLHYLKGETHGTTRVWMCGFEQYGVFSESDYLLFCDSIAVVACTPDLSTQTIRHYSQFMLVLG